MLKPLLKTLPTLSGNVKLACEMTDYHKLDDHTVECYVRNAKLLPLSESIYQRTMNVSLLNSSYEFDLKPFYLYYSNSFYDSCHPFIRNDYIKLDKHHQQDNRNVDFEFGMRRASYSRDKRQLSFFAPVYMESVGDLPDEFRIEVEMKNHFYSTHRTIIVNIGAQPEHECNYLGVYLRKYLRQIDTNVIYCLPQSKQATYYGIDLMHGGFTKAVDNIVSKAFGKQTTINGFDAIITNGFKRNHLAMRQILPLSFEFNLNDILSENDREKFADSIIYVSGSYWKGARQQEMHDIDVDYTDLRQDVLQIDQTRGVLDWVTTGINIMDCEYPALNEAEYINYKHSNKVTPMHCRWKLKYSEDKRPYITNLSWAFSKNQASQYKYSEYPNNFSSIKVVCDEQNNMVLPVGRALTSQDSPYRGDYTLPTNYATILSNYSASWFELIQDYRDMFLPSVEWASVIEDKAMFRGILYDMSNMYAVNPGMKPIDKFGVFVHVSFKKISREQLRDIKSARTTVLVSKKHIMTQNCFVNNEVLHYLLNGRIDDISTMYINESGVGSSMHQVAFNKLFLESQDPSCGDFIDLTDYGIDVHEINRYYKLSDILGTLNSEIGFLPSIFDSLNSVNNLYKHFIDGYELLPIYKLDEIYDANGDNVFEEMPQQDAEWIVDALYFSQESNYHKTKYSSIALKRLWAEHMYDEMHVPLYANSYFISAKDFDALLEDAVGHEWVPYTSYLTQYEFDPKHDTKSDDIYTTNCFIKKDEVLGAFYGDRIPKSHITEDLDLIYVDPYNLNAIIKRYNELYVFDGQTKLPMYDVTAEYDYDIDKMLTSIREDHWQEAVLAICAAVGKGTADAAHEFIERKILESEVEVDSCGTDLLYDFIIYAGIIKKDDPIVQQGIQTVLAMAAASSATGQTLNDGNSAEFYARMLDDNYLHWYVELLYNDAQLSLTEADAANSLYIKKRIITNDVARQDIDVRDVYDSIFDYYSKDYYSELQNIRFSIAHARDKYIGRMEEKHADRDVKFTIASPIVNVATFDVFGTSQDEAGYSHHIIEMRHGTIAVRVRADGRYSVALGESLWTMQTLDIDYTMYSIRSGISSEREQWLMAQVLRFYETGDASTLYSNDTADVVTRRMGTISVKPKHECSLQFELRAVGADLRVEDAWIEEAEAGIIALGDAASAASTVVANELRIGWLDTESAISYLNAEANSIMISVLDGEELDIPRVEAFTRDMDRVAEEDLRQTWKAETWDSDKNLSIAKHVVNEFLNDIEYYDDGYWMFSDSYNARHDVDYLAGVIDLDGEDASTFKFEVCYKKRFIKLNDDLMRLVNVVGEHGKPYKDLYLYRPYKPSKYSEKLKYYYVSSPVMIMQSVSASMCLTPMFNEVHVEEKTQSAVYKNWNQNKISMTTYGVWNGDLKRGLVLATTREDCMDMSSQVPAKLMCSDGEHFVWYATVDRATYSPDAYGHYYRYEGEDVTWMYDVSDVDFTETPIIGRDAISEQPAVFYTFSQVQQMRRSGTLPQNARTIITYDMIDNCHVDFTLGHISGSYEYAYITYSYVDTSRTEFIKTPVVMRYLEDAFHRVYTNSDYTFYESAAGCYMLDKTTREHTDYEYGITSDDIVTYSVISYQVEMRNPVYEETEPRTAYVSYAFDTEGVYSSFHLNTYSFSYTYSYTYSYMCEKTYLVTSTDGSFTSYYVTRYVNEEATGTATSYTTYGMYVLDVTLDNTYSSLNIVDMDYVNKKYITAINGNDIYEEDYSILDTFRYIVPFLKVDMLNKFHKKNLLLNKPSMVTLNNFYKQYPMYTDTGEQYAYNIVLHEHRQSTMTLERYFDSIVPYTPPATMVHDAWLLNFKSMDATVPVSYTTNQLMYRTDLSIHNYEPLKVHDANGGVVDFYPLEHKHFNDNKAVNLTEQFDIHVNEKLTYEQLIEYEKDEVIVGYFRGRLNRNRRNTYDDDETLFLFNRYKVECISMCIGLNPDKNKKLYDLTYRFTLV